MEPEWTRKISSTAICSTYYYLFVINAAVFVFVIVATLALLFNYKMNAGMMIGVGINGLLTAILAAIFALFQYLICSRALLQ